MKLSSSLRILFGLALGLLFGIIFSLLEKDSISSFPEFVAPIGTLWVNAIRMVVIAINGIASHFYSGSNERS